MDKNFQKQRERMVEEQLRGRDITDEKVLEAFSKVPREEFVREKDKEQAYGDFPLSIGHGVTISQPYIVALMCQLLRLEKSYKVLDIGTGSGYEAAILSQICSKVVTIERIDELAKSAEKKLERLGYSNVTVVAKDGSKGYEPEAPYDGIKVAATTENITKEWKKQLRTGGRIVYPEYQGMRQVLIEGIKTEGGINKITHGGVRFVPLIKDSNEKD